MKHPNEKRGGRATPARRNGAPPPRMRLLALTAFLSFAVDQASKYGVLFGLDLLDRARIEVLPPYLVFNHVWNTGINFGLFGGNPEFTRWILIAVALVITCGILYWARRDFERPIEFVVGGLIVGGALANVVDRVIWGAVIDFLNMSCCGINNPYAFNIADVFIFAGAGALVLLPRSEPAGADGNRRP